MKLWLIKKWMKNKVWVIAIGAALLALFSFGFSQRRYGKKIGAAKERAKGTRERVKKAAARGDDAAVLREWQATRKA